MVNVSGFNWTRRGYTREDFERAWTTSMTVADVCRSLGVPAMGGYYNIMRSTAERLGLDPKPRQKTRYVQRNTKARSLEELLVYGTRITTSSVRLRLLKEGWLEHECAKCHLGGWYNHFTEAYQPIPLELDHIDGDLLNNRFSNLRLLCPNCHALTPTYKNRNRKRVASSVA